MAGTIQREESAANSQTVGQPFSYRGFDRERDLAAVVRLINEIDAVDKMERSTSETELAERLTQPTLNPPRDWLVVEHPTEPGRLIAIGRTQSSANDPNSWGFIQVHPEWRRRGIGKVLLAAVLSRSREHGSVEFSTSASSKVPGAVEFVEQAGMERSVTWLELRIEAETPLAEITWPEGFTVKSFDQINDVKLLVDTYNRGFIGHHDHTDSTVEEIEAWLKGDTIKPAGFFIAFDEKGEPAGLVLTLINERRNERLGEQRGYIDTLGVVPEYRRRGLGRTLLLQGVRWLREQGMGPVTLDVYGENERAMPLYTGVGFQPYSRSYEYRIKL